MPGNLQGVPASESSWPTPNYVDPVRRTWIVPYAAVLQAVMTLMLGARLWLRATKRAGALGLDDAFLVPAWLTATIFATMVILSTEKYGSDRHIYDIRPTTFQYTTLAAWLAEFSFLISTSSCRVSVLLFYRRLVKGTYSRRWRLAIFAAIAFQFVYCLGFVLALLLSCQPTEAYWKAYSPTYSKSYHCADITALNPLSGSLSVFSDFYSVVLPMCMLRHFDVPYKQKIALNAVFAFGLLVVAAGSVRTYYLYLLGVNYDTTWIGYDVYVWSTLELQLGLICACAPALRVLFRKYLSDPMARVRMTTRSATSPTWGTNRDSKQTVNGAMVASSHARNTSAGSAGEFGEKKRLTQGLAQGKTSLETVTETEYTSPSRAPSEPHSIRTPADFEAYALQNLQQNRPPHLMVQRPSLGDVRATPNSPLNDWQTMSDSKV